MKNGTKSSTSSAAISPQMLLLAIGLTVGCTHDANMTPATDGSMDIDADDESLIASTGDGESGSGAEQSDLVANWLTDNTNTVSDETTPRAVTFYNAAHFSGRTIGVEIPISTGTGWHKGNLDNFKTYSINLAPNCYLYLYDGKNQSRGVAKLESGSSQKSWPNQNITDLNGSDRKTDNKKSFKVRCTQRKKPDATFYEGDGVDDNGTYFDIWGIPSIEFDTSRLHDVWIAWAETGEGYMLVNGSGKYIQAMADNGRAVDSFAESRTIYRNASDPNIHSFRTRFDGTPVSCGGEHWATCYESSSCAESDEKKDEDSFATLSECYNEGGNSYCNYQGYCVDAYNGEPAY